MASVVELVLIVAASLIKVTVVKSKNTKTDDIISLIAKISRRRNLCIHSYQGITAEWLKLHRYPNIKNLRLNKITSGIDLIRYLGSNHPNTIFNSQRWSSYGEYFKYAKRKMTLESQLVKNVCTSANLLKSIDILKFLLKHENDL